jgi:hypothetical protein
MERQTSNPSDKSVHILILGNSSDKSCKFETNDEKLEKKPSQLDWRKILRIIRNVSSTMSVFITLLKLLQELGLIP